MMTCERCEGAGFNLWMDKGKVHFILCGVCGGERTICFIYGAAPHPPLTRDLQVKGSI